MKTRNIIASIALVALATAAYGQRSTLKERLFQGQADEPDVVFADNSYENSLIKEMQEDFRNWVDSRFSRNRYAAPVVSRSILVKEAEISYAEEVLAFESWMAVPFENSLEERVELESWMAVPFENSLEERVELESWMGVPFEYSLEERVELESWMTVPFKNSLEEEPGIEEWMVKAWL